MTLGVEPIGTSVMSNPAPSHSLGSPCGGRRVVYQARVHRLPRPAARISGENRLCGETAQDPSAHDELDRVAGQRRLNRLKDGEDLGWQQSIRYRVLRCK